MSSRHHELLALILILVSFALFLFKERIVSIVSNSSNLKANYGCPLPDTADGLFDNSSLTGVFNNSLIDGLIKPIALGEQRVLGTADPGDKWIEVDLSEQKIRAWEGDKKVMEFLVSSGKWAPTPTGDFRIWLKLRYTRMTGGKKEIGTYYDLPNVPFTMYFHGSYGIHGAYWHNNFGEPMSHGCVNMRPSEAGELFEWADPVLGQDKTMIFANKEEVGTRVVVHE